MATVLYIECDGCGRRFPKQWKNAGQTINFHVRGEVRLEGWQSDGRRQLDHCPVCVKAGKAPTKRPKVKGGGS